MQCEDFYRAWPNCIYPAPVRFFYSSLFLFYANACFTPSSHFSFGLPLPLLPSTPVLYECLAVRFGSICNNCSHHLSMFCSITSVAGIILRFVLIVLLQTNSLLVFSSTFLRNLVKEAWSIDLCGVRVHDSEEYVKMGKNYWLEDSHLCRFIHLATVQRASCLLFQYVVISLSIYPFFWRCAPRYLKHKNCSMILLLILITLIALLGFFLIFISSVFAGLKLIFMYLSSSRSNLILCWRSL